jgi:small-conductance mechanosensitive channel
LVKQINYKKNRKKRNIFIVANSILKYFLGIISLLIILDINGVNISSLVAGLGVVGIIVGLALQDALKDIIMGKNIITGHFFQVGDVIKYKEITGKYYLLA